MALLGFLLVKVLIKILPFALSFAGGAMLYVISDEIIPESHKRGYEKEATFSIIIGFIIMMILDFFSGRISLNPHKTKFYLNSSIL